MDLVNLGEELADQCWYSANNAIRTKNELIEPDFLTEVTIFLEKENPSTKEEVVCYLFADFLDSSREHDCQRVFDIAFTICEMYGLDFWQILTNNITKLQIRYPEKFTEDAALNRDLKAERKELEKDDTAEN